VKTVIAACGALCAVLLAIPLIGGGNNAPAAGCGITGDVGRILATIRTVESGGNYQAVAKRSSASGAYQFLDSSWNNYGGYRHAADAPPDIQDAKAAEHVNAILTAHHDDVTAVPVIWYIGHLPAVGSPEWDIVPYPDAGNVATPRHYQQRWLTTYHTITPADGTPPPTAATTDDSATAPATTASGDACTAATNTGYALPVARALLDTDPAALTRPHHDYPAWDFGVPQHTPVYAMHAGVVTRISNDLGHCYPDTNGCADICGLGISIRDADNVAITWIYCHASELDVKPGDPITTGQQIMRSGNTGHSSGPHLHLGIRVDGVDRCPQPLLTALATTNNAIPPAQLPTSGCTT
jgi:murein DD-endopeptidase MepM/ murein hydrolase activator NlpD